MYRVIIADDEPLVRSGLLLLYDWESLGFEITAMFDDGKEVLDYLENNQADVLLLDICMFNVSGLEVAAEVMEKYPKIRVIFLSGHQNFEYARDAIRYRVYDYLLKPFDEEEIQKVFLRIKKELDQEQKDEELLQCFTTGDYGVVYEMMQTLITDVLNGSEEKWLVFFKLRMILEEIPEDIRKWMIKRLLNDLTTKMYQDKNPFVEEFDKRIHDMYHREKKESFTRQDFIKLLTELNDIQISGNLSGSDKRGMDERIYSAKQYISNHLSDEFTADNVAEFVNLSRRHFDRLFKTEVGESFLDYLVHERVTAAKRLLKENDIDINDIPEAVGYQDEKYFQRIFKKQVGCSLREYRKRYAK